MVRTRRSTTYPLVYRVLVAVMLTLLVSTASAKRSFLVMHVVKIGFVTRGKTNFSHTL